MRSVTQVLEKVSVKQPPELWTFHDRRQLDKLIAEALVKLGAVVPLEQIAAGVKRG